MKKLSLILMSSLLVLSCQNYDDQFDDINQQLTELSKRLAAVEALNGQIAALNSQVVALSAALASLTSENSQLNSQIDDLQAQVLAVISDLASLSTTLSGTNSDLEAVSADLAALQATVNGILSNDSIYDKDIVVDSIEDAEFAKQLGDKVSVVNANVTIHLTTGSGLTAADVNEFTSKMKIIVGNLTVITNASIDLSALTHVGGTYTVQGHDVDDAALISVGNLVADYDGGYDFGALEFTGDVTLVEYTAASSTAKAGTTGTITIDFGSLKTNDQFAQADDVTVNADGTVTFTNLQTAQLNFALATSISFGKGFDPSGLTIIAPKATSVTVLTKAL